MSSPNTEQESCRTLARFEAALQKHRDFAILKSIVDREANINCQIPDTDHTRSHKPKLIGSTLLHLARRSSNFDIFKYLLDRGIDFTIKNRNGSTAILQPIENALDETPTETLNNKYTELILSTHVSRNISANPCNDHGISHFHVACMLSDVATIEFFLQNRALVNEPISKNSPIFPGYSPLHLAVTSNSARSVETLLQHGANANVTDLRGKTPLHILIERKAKLLESEIQSYSEGIALLKNLEAIDEKLRLLLQYYTTLMIDDTGLSHLHTACILPNTPALQNFVSTAENVELAIRPDSPFFPGYTPLHFAMFFKSPLAMLLLQKGANIVARDAHGVTPFDVLLRRKDVERIHLALSSIPAILLSDGHTTLSDLVISMKDENTFATRRLDARVPRDSPLFPDFTALHLAVMFHKDRGFGIVQRCLNDQPSDILARDSRGSTPLHLAFRLRKVHAVHWLLEHGDIRENVIDADGLSILHIAVAAQNERMVEKLLTISRTDIDTPLRKTFEWFHDPRDADATKSFVINDGSTLLHIAVAMENLGMVILLLYNEANIYAADAHGLTPIHRVLVADTYKRVGNRLFLDPKLQDRVAADLNLSHLHVACFLNNVAAVERFLDSGSSIEAAVKCSIPFLAHLQGLRPIHMAMREENLEVLRFLLDRGADILAKLPDGSTPFYWHLINRPRFFLPFFREELGKRDDVLRRIENDIGLTILHIACYELDLDLVQYLLRRGARVDARVSSDSPIWPDCTPLYVSIARCKNIDDTGASRIIAVVGLLLEHGADVSETDVRGDSPLHLADEMLADADEQNNSQVSWIMRTFVTEMLSRIRDFTVNPKSKRGISQFHVACRACDVNKMKDFLNNGCDVNERVHCLFDNRWDGYTPLHLAMSCCLADNRNTEAVELLLNYGADCHAKTLFGDTPVHTAARCNDGPLRIDLLQRLVREGADLQTRNLLGQTSFEIVLKSQTISAEEITLFLGSGLRANTYNSITELGYLALAIDKKCHDSPEQVLDILLNNCNFHETDQGRTAIHNVVSAKRYIMPRNPYVELIRKMMIMGCEIDGQDDIGRTALHSAVQFDNYQAVEALLIIGADVNILDADDQSATSYMRSYITTDSSSSNMSLALHICQLRQLHLEVIQQNIHFQQRVSEENPIVERRMLGFAAELTKAESLYLGSTSISLRSFLSGNGIVAAYPTMPLVEREEIQRFFETGEELLENQLPELQGLLRLQYRKALRRCEIIDSAKSSLQNLFMKIMGLNLEKDFTECIFNEVRFFVASRPSITLPEPCCETILKYLTNREISNLVASTENCKL